MGARLQPVSFHSPANKSSLLATVSIQRQITYPWHTAKQYFPFDHYVGALKIHCGQVGLDTGKYRHFLMASFPVTWIPLLMIPGAVQVVFAVAGTSHEQGNLSESCGSRARADGIHQGLPGIHCVAEGGSAEPRNRYGS